MKQTSSNKNTISGLGVGTSSILMIFVLLCLVVFAVLSFVSANADWKLNDKLAKRTSAYYEACEKAQDFLEEIDSRLDKLYMENPSMDQYTSACRSYLETIAGHTSLESDSDRFSFYFTETLSDEQYLAVTISIPFSPVPGGHYYKITAWQTKASQAWDPDTHLNVLE